MKIRVMAAIAALLFAFVSTSAQARHHHYSHHRSHHYAYRGGGKCDGFQRCRCGTTAARHFGLAYNHNGWNLKEAREWKRFPHTSFHVGAAGVVEHHVLAITGGSDCAHAQVHDDAGDYSRNVCHMTFVEPAGGGFTQEASAQPRQHRQHSRHRHTDSFDVASSDAAMGTLGVH